MSEADGHRPLLVVILPALDEATTIGGVIAELRARADGAVLRHFVLRLFVVDDGSYDATPGEARRAGADRVLEHGTHRGLGAAVRTGLAAARAAGADVVVKLDADGQHDPADLEALLQPIVEDCADVVYGDRSAGMGYRMPLVRRAGNALFSGLMRWLTGWPVRDGQPGIFALSRAYLERCHLPGDYNYAQQLLLDAYHKGMRFAQVPVRFRPRTAGTSFVGWTYPFRVIGQLALVLVGIQPMRVFAPIGAAFLAFAAIVAAWQIGEWWWVGAVKPIRNVNLVLGTGLFGLQTLFFGLLAELVVSQRRD